MITDTQISCFLAAAKAESFSDAAESLYMSPPTLGRQISALEQELGFPLFQRAWKNNQLTAAGEIMFNGLSAMRDEFTALVGTAREAAARITGKITLGLLEGQLVDPKLREVLQELNTHFPGITVDLPHFSFREMLDGIRKGSLDAGITLTEDAANFPEDFNILPLYSLKNDLVMPNNNPLAGRPNPKLSDFAEETFVEIEQSDSAVISRLMLESCRQSGFTPKTLTVKNLKAQITAVELGRGIAAFNCYHQSFNHPGLAHVSVPELPDVEFSLVWSKAAGNSLLPYLIDQILIAFKQSG